MGYEDLEEERRKSWNRNSWSKNPRRVFTYWTGKESPIILLLRELIYKHSDDGKNYEVTFLTDRNITEFIKVPAPVFDLSPNHKSDFIRVNILYKYGGIWLDADTIVMSDLSLLFEFVEKKDGFLVREWNACLCTGVFGSRRGTPLLREWKNRIDARLEEKTELGWSDIGPWMLEGINNQTDLGGNYEILMGLDTIYPSGPEMCVSEFLIRPRSYALKLRNNFQPLIILVNPVYNAVRDLNRMQLLGLENPLSVFLNESLRLCSKNNSCGVLVYVPDTKYFVDQFWGLYHSVVTNECLSFCDFIVACPTDMTEKLPQNPQRCKTFITGELAADTSFRYYNGNPYEFINSFVHFKNEEILRELHKYTNLLRIDCDTFICPSFKGLELSSNEIMVGQGAYNNEVVRSHLVETAKKLSFDTYNPDKTRNVGSTWFSRTETMIPLGKKTIEVVSHLLNYDETFVEGEGVWPEWYAGVVLLYAGDLVVNSTDLKVTKQEFDGGTASTKDISTYFTLHSWHSEEYFSKMIWNNFTAYSDIPTPQNPSISNEYAHFHAHEGREERKKRYSYEEDWNG